MTRSFLLLMACALLAAGCSSGDDGDNAGEALGTPTFAPVGEDSPAETVPVEGDEAGDVPAPTTTTEPGDDPADDAATTTTTEAPAPKEVVRVDDEVGDARGGLSEDPPAWTDLTGVTVVRQNNALAVRVSLAGGDAPETSNGVETMNIATFFDVDGDGQVDFEIWANLGPEGWGAGWFDDEGHAAYGEDSNVSITPREDVVSILFPQVMIDTPESFRFSVSSEYGELDTLGTSFARRDDIPGDGQVIAFP